jgi:hypothetical protein
VRFEANLKIADDINAKYEIWAREGKVYPCPRPIGIPRFGARKFSSYEEFNAWKRALIEQIASAGGVRWTR